MKNSNKILFIIFFVTVIPTIYVYWGHGYEEYSAYVKSIEKGNEYKATKQLGESVLFVSITLGYIVTAMVLLLTPWSRTPYLILIIGTIAIVILYYLRIYGIPVIGTDIVIRDLSTDYRDVITKISQQIMIVPLSILLVKRHEL